MMRLGLSPAERRQFEAALADTHIIRLHIGILNQNESPIGSLTAAEEMVLDGSVTVDATQDITRKLDLKVLDPHRKLELDPDSPAQATLFPDHFVSVIYSVWVEAMDNWVDTPVFYGPMTRYARDGVEVTIEAMGKELLGLEPNLLWRTRNFGKGANVRGVIRTLMAEQGEEKFSMGETTHRLKKRLTVKKRTSAWLRCKKLAASANRQLYYAGDGHLRWRRKTTPQDPVFIFHDGNAEDKGNQGHAGNLLTTPTVEDDFLDFANVVVALGGTPKGPKGSNPKRKTYVAVPPATHQLSPQNLKRNGVPRRMVVVIENSEWTRDSEVRENAEEELKRRLSLAQTVSFDALPVPHLEELDPVRVEATDAFNDIEVTFLLEQWTLPLTSSQGMSVGYNRRVVRRRHHKRRKPKPKKDKN